MMFKKTSLATLRIKGIRAQLFFGFGALVVVINLFYFRMTTLFVDVTEGWVSHYILTSEAQNFAQSGNNSTSKNGVSCSDAPTPSEKYSAERIWPVSSRGWLVRIRFILITKELLWDF